MLSLARNGYSESAVDAALHAPTRKIYFRYNLLDSSNNFKKSLTNVTSGHVAYDTTQPIKRTAQFTLQDDGTINFASDRIQPWVYLMMTDGGFAKFPLGVFLLSTPPRQTDPAQVVTRQIDGYDQCQVLVDDKVGDRYTIASGTNYISAIQTLLSGAGISQMNLQATTLTLPTALDYKGGTAKLDIVNDLLKAINYRALWFDENGVAQAIPYMTPAQRNADYTYEDDENSVMFPDLNDNIDFFSVPNKWICVVSETDRDVVVSTYTNTNANSPTSTTNRGRTIVKYFTQSNAPDQATNDSIAERMAFQDSQVYETVVFETAIMPMHSDYDVLQFNYSVLGVSDKFSEIGWSFDLVAGARMSHTIQKVVQY